MRYICLVFCALRRLYLRAIDEKCFSILSCT